MNKSTMLKGRPVTQGTLLSFTEDAEEEFENSMGEGSAPEYVRVTGVYSDHITYESDAVDGEVKISQLSATFEHYNPGLQSELDELGIEEEEEDGEDGEDRLAQVLAVPNAPPASLEDRGVAQVATGRSAFDDAPNRYVLRYMTDLLDIPDDRLDDCLDQLKESIRAVRLGRTAMIASIEEETGKKLEGDGIKAATRMAIPHIVWADDGEHKTSLTHNGQKVMEVNVITAKPKTPK
jgi:hypothetical protein